jgi:cellulose synthase (UDP-forming)
LPKPPTEREKTSYIHRELQVLIVASVLSMSMLLVSQIHFITLSPWLLVFAPYLVFTVIYFLISLWINIRSRDFDLKRHQRLVRNWRPTTYPSVDIMLPICGEDLAVLENTWASVEHLRGHYRGHVEVYVLDDADNPDAAASARSVGFNYLVRPNRGWFKKAGNLRHGYSNSSGEFMVIFDADFAPREDFLDELLPHMAENPTLGIVQSPQYFRFDRRQSLMERGAGAVQELFYRVVQVSRDHFGAAICVGSCAVYRRAALDSIGGTALIEHSEDVHTGFDLAGAGWATKYVPIPLATGLCPSDPDAFLTQQYRWCTGSMSLLKSSKFWQTKLGFNKRLCFSSGFCYYIHTAIFSIMTPLIPIVIVLALPEQVQLHNYLWIVPSVAYNLIVFPLWNRGRYGIEALMTKALYGWAHLFAISDILRKRTAAWQPTGGKVTSRKTDRVWRGMILWGGATGALWVGACLWRMYEYRSIAFAFLLLTGLLYCTIIAMALYVRRQGRKA